MSPPTLSSRTGCPPRSNKREFLTLEGMRTLRCAVLRVQPPRWKGWTLADRTALLLTFAIALG